MRMKKMLTMQVKLPTYRYKATTEITERLNVFAKTYQHSKREDFKDAWKIWIELNAELIQSETERLESCGYKGDIVDKMFKSARYYYRNKTPTEPKIKKEYENISSLILLHTSSFLMPLKNCKSEISDLTIAKENNQPKPNPIANESNSPMKLAHPLVIDQMNCETIKMQNRRIIGILRFTNVLSSARCNSCPK